MKAVLIALLLASGLVAQQHPLQRQFLVNRDVVALARAGFGEQTIIDMILVKPNRFDTAAEALAALAAQGISQRIVQVMLVVKKCGPASDLAGPSPCGPVPVRSR